jgi:5-methylcytosine-specific restriction enzyme subunit McrC
MTRHLIRLREWERVRIGEGHLTPSRADALLAAARASDLGGEEGTRILVHAGSQIATRQVVGLISAGDCQLEILPKIDGVESDAGVRDRLVHMLAEVYDLPVATGAAAALGEQNDTLLERLIRLFADRLIDAARAGLPRRYQLREEDLPALRGRLAIMRQFTALATDPTRLACRYDELSRDIPLNRIMKAVVTRLRALARGAETQRRLGELAFAYDDVASIGRRSLPWSQLHLDRSDRRWRPLIDLARLLLGDRFQTTSAGKEEGTALLFEMHVLFEAYIARVLARELLGTGLRVVAQGGLRFCLTELDGDGQLGKDRFQTRPDILIKRGDVVVAIIDTKWKRLSPRTDDAKQDVSQADVYQMIAYGRLYDCSNLILLYPWHSGIDSDDEPQRYAVRGSSDTLSIVTVDVARSGREAGRQVAAALTALNIGN